MLKILHLAICALLLLLCGCMSHPPAYYPPPQAVPAAELAPQPVYETMPAPPPVLQPVAQPIEVGPVYYEQTTWGDPFWYDHPPVHYMGGHGHHHHHDSHARHDRHHGPAVYPPARSRGSGSARPHQAGPRPSAAPSRPTSRPAVARPTVSRPASRPTGARPSGPRPSGARPSAQRPSGSRSGHGGRGRR